MNDRDAALDIDSLKAETHKEQIDAEINDTAERVGAYYDRLRRRGIPEESASAMAAEYNSHVLERHFCIDIDDIDPDVLRALE